ncbi:MAG: hypothetical protein IPO77_11525 [Acidobacteria bacterium]|nr:hypothetical protein [Acidobacteriota bacterium]
MKKTGVLLIVMLIALMAGTTWQANAQSTSGVISGAVTDENQGVITNATVTVRNVGTNESRTARPTVKAVIVSPISRLADTR